MLTTTTLHHRALEILRANGLEPDFPASVVEQSFDATPVSRFPESPLPRDLRHLLWSSIDSVGARDLDQVEYVEEITSESDPNAVTGYRVFVGIADVAAAVPENSALDTFAAARGTSVYTGAEVFPLLPEQLTQQATSLSPGVDRPAIVAEAVVGIDGIIRESQVYAATVRNKARMDYGECGAWLLAMNHHQPTESPVEISSVVGLTEQVMLQWFAAQALRIAARRRGALELDTPTAAAVIAGDSVVDLTLRRRTLARTIIETFMLAANTAITDFLHARGMASIERIVRLPAHWPRLIELARKYGTILPEHPDAKALALFLERQSQEHPDEFLKLSQVVARLIGSGRYEMIAPTQNMADVFGPDISGYTHSTAPNRRYTDLVMQRQVKSALARTDSGRASPPAYTNAQLAEIAEKCNLQITAARRAERAVRKVAAAELLAQRIGAEFEGLVTSVKENVIYARATDRPVEGRIIRGDLSKLETGDTVQLRLIHVDPKRGWIDFALIDITADESAR